MKAEERHNYILIIVYHHSDSNIKYNYKLGKGTVT